MNAKVAVLLKREGQSAFEKKYPNMDFRKIFGKNHLTEEDGPRQQACEEPAAAAGEGVTMINGVSGMDEKWRCW